MNAIETVRLLLDAEDKEMLALTVVLRNASQQEVLLVTDANGLTSLPGGHQHTDETIEQAALRELSEETGLRPDDLRYLTQAFHPARGHPCTVFYATVPPGVQMHSGDDAKGARWQPVDDLNGLDQTDEIFILAAAQRSSKLRETLERHISEARQRGYVMLLGEAREPVKGGCLIVFEGIDGVGKSTQLEKTRKWLEKKGRRVVSTAWNSSPLLKDALRQAKQNHELTPMLFSLLHASDLTWRYTEEIEPALEKGKIVLCDRYYYTSYVRDGLRGIGDKLLDLIYEGFRKPDILFHFVVPVRTAVERLMRDRGVKYYSAGMDIDYGTKSKEQSAAHYERDMDLAYKRVLSGVRGYQKIDTERTIEEVFESVKEILKKKLHDYDAD